jgi:hypothetical protein
MIVINRLIISALMLALMSCAGVSLKPTSEQLDVKLRRFEVLDASFEYMRTEVIVEVKSAAAKNFSASAGQLEVTIVGHAVIDEEGTHVDASDSATSFTGRIFKGTLAGATSVVAQEKTLLHFPVTLEFPDDATELEKVINWERALLGVKGTVTIDGHEFSFGGERELGLPVLPEIVAHNPQVASTDGGKNGVAFFQVLIRNPNTFVMNVDKFSWGASLAGKELRQVGVGGPEEIPPSSALELDDEIPLTTTSFGPNLRKVLRQHLIPYRVKGFWSIKGIHREFDHEGELEFAR